MRAVLAGLAADGAGNLYLADNRNNRIEKFRLR
jgi:NHL repeat